MNASALEAQLYQDAYQLLNIHELLLRDGVRNAAFQAALERSEIAGARVLDVGAGSGIWAIQAAKLGARRVVAIEREPLLIGLIRALAHDNGVADRVEVIQGDAQRIQLEERFDIVVSETIGHSVFDELIVPILIDARDRFLADGGRLIPERVSLVAAPAVFDSGSATLPAEAPGDFSCFEKLALHMPVAVNGRKRIRLLAEPVPLVSVDLQTAKQSPLLQNLSASWNVSEAAGLNSVLVWATISLGHGIELQSIDTSNWNGTAYRMERPSSTSGRLEFQLSLDAATHHWAVIWDGAAGKQTQSFSPAIAATDLLAQTRMDTAEFRKWKEMANFRFTYDRHL